MGLSVRERILRFLSELQGQYIPQATLSKAIKASKSRISEVLSDLERNGLITRFKIGNVKVIYVKPGLHETEYIRPVRTLRLGIVYSSEYLYLGGFAKILRSRGINLDIVVFNDGLEATRALAMGTIDLAFSPLISQLYLLPAYRTFRIIARGVKGGFRVLYKPGDSVVYSSMISTMDYLRLLALSRKMIEAERTIYYHSVSDLFKNISKGGYLLTWHPLYRELMKYEFTVIYGPGELDPGLCCTLGVSSGLSRRVAELIRKAYVVALEEYRREPDRYLEYYASITGIPVSVLKDAISDYVVVEKDGARIIQEIFNTLNQRLPSQVIYEGLVE